MSSHNWIKSTLGHGETMCTKCFATNREAAVLGMFECPEPDPIPSPLDKRGITREGGEVRDGSSADESGSAFWIMPVAHPSVRKFVVSGLTHWMPLPPPPHPDGGSDA